MKIKRYYFISDENAAAGAIAYVDCMETLAWGINMILGKR